MKKQNFAEYKTKNVIDLRKKIVELEKELVVLRLELKMNKIKNVHALNQKRKDIARLNTILRQATFTKEGKDVSS